jgi:hypothetical protein
MKYVILYYIIYVSGKIAESAFYLFIIRSYMMKNLRFIFAMMVVLLTLAFSNAKAQPPESCLVESVQRFEIRFYSGTYENNYTKIYFDTCGIRNIWFEHNGSHGDYDLYDNFDTAYSYFNRGGIETQMGTNWSKADFFYRNMKEMERIYSNSVFYLLLKYNPFDTTGKNFNELNYLTTDDISDNYQSLKNRLKNLETKYGKMKIYIGGDLSRFDLSNWFKSHSNSSSIGVFVMFDKPVNAYQIETENSDFTIRFISEFTYPVGIVESANLQPLQISPNPAQNKLTITIDELIPYELIKIYSMDGILVKELNFQSEIDISDLTSGVYLIKYGNQSGKFVKE